MAIINVLAFALIFMTGAYFILLGFSALFRPNLAARFLLGFATSVGVHYLELFLRLIIGLSFIQRSPNMLFPDVFAVFGWLLIGTTACLFLLPWNWHQKFAQKAVPFAIPYLKLIGIISLVLGVVVLISVLS